MTGTLVGAFDALATDQPDATAIVEKRYGRWVAQSARTIAGQAGRLANGFASIGIGSGDIVAFVVPARLEWITLDLAVQAVGGRVLAIPEAFRGEDVAGAIATSQAATVVVAGQDEADLILTAVDEGQLPDVVRIVYIDPAGVSDYASELLLSVDELDVDGEGLGERVARLDPAATAVVVPSHDASRLIEISHATLLQSAQATIAAFDLGARDRVVSARDIADPVERGATVYAALLSGATLAIPESAATVDAAVHEIAPTYVHLTERWLAQKAARITVRFDENRGIKAWVARSWRRRTGSTLERYGSGRPPAGLWRIMVSIPVLEELGLEKARAVVVTGTPAPAELLGFYTALGLPVRTGLGLAELAGFATVGVPADVDGFVGGPLDGISADVESGRLVVTTPATGRVQTGLGVVAAAEGFVVNGDSPEEAAEARLRSIPVFATALVAPGATTVTIELDGAIASRWATKNQLDAATYRSFSQLTEMRQSVESAVRAMLEPLGLTLGEVIIAVTPFEEVPGALSFGDVPRRDLIGALTAG